MFRFFTKSRVAKLLPTAALVLSGLVFSNTAQAIPIEFTTDPGNTTAEFTSTSGFCLGLPSGCTPLVVVNPTPVTFELSSIGDSFNIMDFLTVSIGGASLVAGGEGTLETQLAFSAPSSAISSAATATGTFSSFLFWADGEVQWDTQPANLLFDDGTEIELAFTGGSAACGPGRGRSCRGGLSVGIDAETTLRAVPEPGALALLGAGLFGFGAYRRFGMRRT